MYAFLILTFFNVHREKYNLNQSDTVVMPSNRLFK